MSNELANKVIMIGFDGGNWPFIERFIRDGRLPNLANLMDTGVYSESLPVMPCDTPTNWSTLVTGAWPGTHGITSFHIHLPGEPLNKVHFSVRSYWSNAEFLWDAAERAGKRTASIMWPLSFPPTCRTGIFVDGTGPRDPHWRVAYDALYSTNPLPPSYRHRGDIPVTLIKAYGWKNIPREKGPGVIKREQPHKAYSLLLHQNKMQMILSFWVQRTSSFFQNRHARSFGLDNPIASRNAIQRSGSDITGKKVDSLYSSSLKVDILEMEVIFNPL